MTLDALGQRLCILGPSNSGKSTLAAAIGRARDMTVVHLDQLHHQPGSDWHPRPFAEFEMLHENAISGDRWVIDGSYSRLLPQRLARATGVILLDVPTAVSLTRYLRCCWSGGGARIGGLDGGSEAVTWEMLHHILVVTRSTRRRNAGLFDRVTLPKLRLAGVSEVAAFYASEGLAG